jgi:hypothetical protein
LWVKRPTNVTDGLTTIRWTDHTTPGTSFFTILVGCIVLESLSSSLSHRHRQLKESTIAFTDRCGLGLPFMLLHPLNWRFLWRFLFASVVWFSTRYQRFFLAARQLSPGASRWSTYDDKIRVVALSSLVVVILRVIAIAIVAGIKSTISFTDFFRLQSWPSLEVASLLHQ